MPDMKYCPWCGTPLSEKKIDDESRLACGSDSCNYIYWNNPTPVVAAVIEHEGRVLLARNKDWPEKMFGLITGFLEKGETPEEAVCREVKEEVGLSSEIEGFIGMYSFFQANQLILAYHVKARGEISLGDEIEEVKHIDPEKLRPWPIGTGPAVKDWLESRKGSRFYSRLTIAN